MQEHKTQQFAKFYLKDIKNKLHKDLNQKKSLDKITISSTN